MGLKAGPVSCGCMFAGEWMQHVGTQSVDACNKYETQEQPSQSVLLGHETRALDLASSTVPCSQYSNYTITQCGIYNIVFVCHIIRDPL